MNELRFEYFVFAALLLLANAFFVVVEFSLVGLRRTKIEELIREGRRGAVRVKLLLDNLDEYLSSCQVGITLTSLAMGWIGEVTFARLFQVLLAWLGLPAGEGSLLTAHALGIGCGFLTITFLHVVVGEQVPKTFALQFPETLALWTAWPMRVFNRICYPLVWALLGSTRATTKFFGLKAAPAHHRVHSEEELSIILDESRRAGVLSSEERKMLERVFRFHDKTVKEIMVPRPDIAALDIRTKDDQLLKTVIESGYSRLPVYDGNFDKIVGIVNVKDIIYTLQHPKLIKLADLVREVLEVPESYSVSRLLKDLQKRRIHMALVVDEFGATAGLVTMEDLIEEIVGEIRDEHDNEEADAIEQRADGSVGVDAKLDLDRFREVIGAETELPEGSFDTVGGLVLHLAGHLPKEGETLRLGEWAIRVIKRDGRRVRKIALRKVPAGSTQILSQFSEAVIEKPAPPPPPRTSEGEAVEKC